MGRAVALFVQRSIASWRGSPKRITHAVADRSRFPPTGQHVTTKPSDPWELARRNFPHVDDETGIVATRMCTNRHRAAFSGPKTMGPGDFGRHSAIRGTAASR